MWNMTGICHHAGGCRGYMESCGNCGFLGRGASPKDLSAKVWRRKSLLYAKVPVTFVAVSRWLRERCRESSLLCDADVRVIPNAFRMPDYALPMRRDDGKLRLLFAAARIDDPVKGLPLLRGALSRLAEECPRLASRIELTFCGDVRNREALSGMAVATRYAGMQTQEQMAALYRQTDIVVSSSLYETLPGTLVEAQAYGALPVAFDRGGQSDIVDDGVTGVLACHGDTDAVSSANLAHALVRAAGILDSTPRAVLQQRLYESVEGKFSSESVVRSYISLFEELTGRSAL